MASQNPNQSDSESLHPAIVGHVDNPTRDKALAMASTSSRPGADMQFLAIATGQMSPEEAYPTVEDTERMYCRTPIRLDE